MQKVIYFFCVPHILDNSGRGKHRIFKETLLIVHFNKNEPQSDSVRKLAKMVIGSKKKVDSNLVVLTRWIRVEHLDEVSYEEEVLLHF